MYGPCMAELKARIPLGTSGTTTVDRKFSPSLGVCTIPVYFVVAAREMQTLVNIVPTLPTGYQAILTGRPNTRIDELYTFVYRLYVRD